MATLEDVKAFIRTRDESDWDRARVAADVARRFGMSRDEADRVVLDLEDEGFAAQGAPVVENDTVLPGEAVLAAGAAAAVPGTAVGTGFVTGAATGAAAVGFAQIEAEQDEEDAEELE